MKMLHCHAYIPCDKYYMCQYDFSVIAAKLNIGKKTIALCKKIT